MQLSKQKIVQYRISWEAGDDAVKRAFQRVLMDNEIPTVNAGTFFSRDRYALAFSEDDAEKVDGFFNTLTDD